MHEKLENSQVSLEFDDPSDCGSYTRVLQSFVAAERLAETI